MSPDMDRILKNARIHVPGALDDVLKLELYNVAREYCDGSDVWRQEILLNIVADRASYDLVLADAEPARLLSLLDQNDVPVAATMDEPGVLVLRETPTTAGQYTATVSLLPDQTDTDDLPVLPDWLVKKYWEDLKDGLIARMMAQPHKPYSNPPLALVHQRRFNTGKATAKANAAHSNLYGGQTWRFPSMAMSRRK